MDASGVEDVNKIPGIIYVLRKHTKNDNMNISIYNMNISIYSRIYRYR